MQIFKSTLVTSCRDKKTQHSKRVVIIIDHTKRFAEYVCAEGNRYHDSVTGTSMGSLFLL